MGFVTIWLFWTLVAMPIVLLLASQVYVMRSQDAKGRYTVLLDAEATTKTVVGEHADRFGIEAVEVWSASVKGYTALVPVRRLKALRADERVVSVEPVDVDELSDRWRPG